MVNTPKFGPRLQKLRDKQNLELGKINYTYEDFKDGTPKTKVKILEVRPDIALGSTAGKDFEDVQNRIYFILATTLMVAILTTVSYYTLKGDDKISEYLVASFSISWFLFISFIFLLFNATRLLHIIFFAVIIGLSSNVYHVLDKETPQINKETQNIVMAATVFAGAAVTLLIYYYLVSRKEEELIEIKSKEKLRLRNEELTKLVAEAKKAGKEEAIKEYESSFQNKLGQKAIGRIFATPKKKKPTPKKTSPKKTSPKKSP